MRLARLIDDLARCCLIPAGCLAALSAQALPLPNGNPPGTGWQPGQDVLGYVEQACGGSKLCPLNSITGCKPPRRRGGDHIVGNDENGIEAGLIFSDVKEANGIMQVVDAVPTPRPADDCSDTSSQASLDLCANRNFQRSDAELNVLYKRIAERLKDNKETAALLIKAEVAWVAFRDAECSFSASGAETGSVYPMIVSQCRQVLTDKRNEQLRRYLTCEEGDMSCPVPAR